MRHLLARRRSRALGLGSVVLLAACSSGHASSAYPDFLPKDTLDVPRHQVVDGSAVSPALASQGDPVRVHLAGGAVVATVTGPEVPNEGLPVKPETTPAQWTVELSQATTTLPVDARAFEAIDGSGRVYRLAATGAPSAVAPGQDLTFTLRSPAFEVGEGRVRWIPSGHLAPVEWDFTAEID